MHLRQQSIRANAGQYHKRIRAFRIIEDACHLSIAPFDDLEDIKVSLMRALSAVVHDTLDLGKHAFAEAFEREWMHAPQHLPVRFGNGVGHGADSIIVEAKPKMTRLRL
jgi:hypothetical protein